MKAWEVTYFESGKLVTVRIASAVSGSDARKKADAVCPSGAHLATKRYYRTGVTA